MVSSKLLDGIYRNSHYEIIFSNVLKSQEAKKA